MTSNQFEKLKVRQSNPIHYIHSHLIIQSELDARSSRPHSFRIKERKKSMRLFKFIPYKSLTG